VLVHVHHVARRGFLPKQGAEQLPLNPSVASVCSTFMLCLTGDVQAWPRSLIRTCALTFTCSTRTRTRKHVGQRLNRQALLCWRLYFAVLFVQVLLCWLAILCLAFAPAFAIVSIQQAEAASADGKQGLS
jgi:hypothetical protein